MSTIQERLQRKREPLDKWSIREQLCLSFAVAKVGDQNWMSVSRSLKPFGEGRPADWFHQKNCAAQYGALLENIDTPKRKKRASGVDALESPAEVILKKLIQERLIEMKTSMEEEKLEYNRLQEDMTYLKSGAVTEEELDAMCKQIDEEEQLKENEALAHAQWLKEREARKAELERVWRPTVKIPPPSTVVGQKRKASESIDQLIQDAEENLLKSTPDSPAKPPALSPLLTSLLKLPSHTQNAATSSILHSAITNTPRTTTPNPTIASLLNSSASVHVSPGIQQLVTSAIAQEPPQSASKHPLVELLDSADPLPNLKVEDIEDTILSVGGDLAEIKNEEVDVIISDLIEKHSHIVTDPETHLLDGDDIITNLENELKELDNKEKAERKEQEIEVQSVQVKQEAVSETPLLKDVEVDPFEFQEDDPEVEVKLPRSTVGSVPMPISAESPSNGNNGDEDEEEEDEDVAHDTSIEVKEEIDLVDIKEEEFHVGSDHECVAEESVQEHAINEEVSIGNGGDMVEIKEEPVEKESENDRDLDNVQETSETGNAAEVEPELAEVEAIIATSKEDVIDDADALSRRDTFTPEYSEPSLFDENIEVTKMDKIGKAKRDYSRTKKREEPELDLLLAVNDEEAESGSEQEESKKADMEVSVKVDAEHSHSPWTESEEPEVEAEQETRPQTRRYSTPATPIDSVPNSPASSHFEDDREYRSWKKSVMLAHSRLVNHKYSSLFLKPITNEQAPGYHKYIKRPMDLTTIKKNIESGVVRTTAEFKRDLLLMFHNAIMFNKTDDAVYKMTLEIQREAVEQLRMLFEAQTDNVVLPARRETRTSELGTASKRKRDSDSLQPHNKSKKRREDF